MEAQSRGMPPVLLSWTDAESGEELCILVHGPPQFLADLRADGFRPVPEGSHPETDPHRAPCVVVANP